MRVKIIFFSYILVLALVGCKSKYDIYKTYAFSRKITAGNIPVDQNNKPTISGVQKVHLVYIETKADVTKPLWDTAWIDGVAYSIEPLKITQNKITLGKTKDETEKIEISAEPQNALWQLLLNPLPGIKPNGTILEKTATNPIVLSGLWNNKPVNFGIKKETELATIFSE